MNREFSKNNLKKWELEIVEKYPILFLEGAKDGNCNLRYGFEFQEGWKNLIDEFAKTASELVVFMRNLGFTDNYIHSCICKEKFGTLHWQGDSKLEKPIQKLFNTLVKELNRESQQTCEMTGKLGKLMVRGGYHGYYKTLSEDMAKELGYISFEEARELNYQKITEITGF